MILSVKSGQIKDRELKAYHGEDYGCYTKHSKIVSDFISAGNSDNVLKIVFDESQKIKSSRSAIYQYLRRAGMDVDVFMRGNAVYLVKRGGD